MELNEFSFVPDDFRRKDPRVLAYRYRKSIIRSEVNFIAFVRQLQSFYHYQNLEVAEQMARIMNSILVPADCLHWRRATHFNDRRVQVGKNAFYLMKDHEMTELEKRKFMNLHK